MNDDGYVEVDRIVELLEAIKSTVTKVTMYQFGYFMDTSPKSNTYAARMRSNYEKYLEYVGL